MYISGAITNSTSKSHLKNLIDVREKEMILGIVPIDTVNSELFKLSHHYDIVSLTYHFLEGRKLTGCFH